MWILLSFLYAMTNALYTAYNDKHHYNGYVLGIWRGFGVSLFSAPLLTLTSLHLPLSYLLILTIQGILIGIYDSHLFFASARYGSKAGSGFMTTCVLITAFLWWGIEIEDFKRLIKHQRYFMTLMFILCAYSISYWQMMKPHLSKQAELYLYPATFALSLMSIATRFIAIHGGSMFAGITYYLTISCFISGIYNSVAYFRTVATIKNQTKPTPKQGLYLISLSVTLISAKTAAMRLCKNPAYVIAVLLISPLFAELLEKHKLRLAPSTLTTIILLCMLLSLLNFKNAYIGF